LHFFATLYFANLIANVVSAGIQIKTNPIFFAGLFSFMTSDFFIGMDYLDLVHQDLIISGFYLLAIGLVASSLILRPTIPEYERIDKKQV